MTAIPAALDEKIRRFPASPGVYIMKDVRNRTIYVGKAVNLCSRVRSYFVRSSDTRVFHRHLVERVHDIDCIVTASETEALLLENNLIKKRRPLFNIRLRDDKSYLCLEVTLAEEWPRVRETRRRSESGNVRFGPFGSASSVRTMLDAIERIFRLRSCSNGQFADYRSRGRPCINHDIDRCSAPCVGLVSAEAYREDVERVLLFLGGERRKLVETLEARMREASSRRQFEVAARYRDQIRAIERVFETQKAQEAGTGDIDIFGSHREGDHVVIHELVVRDGKIVNSDSHSFESGLSTEEVFASFLAQYYLADRFIPQRILCEIDFPERQLLRDWLRERRGRAVDLLVPRRGDKRRLVEMAVENARNAFDVSRSRSERTRAALAALRDALELPRPPRRIECFDVSCFHGSLAVASMAVFEDGAPARSQYRKYRIRSIDRSDDFAMMREVLERRFSRCREDPDSLPDLVVIDGGKGQLGVAVEVLRALDAGDVPVVGLAKERRSKGSTERVFVPGRRDPIPLPQRQPASLLLQHLRDEAHRTAVSYHRALRAKATHRTGLEEIDGVGKRTIEKLMRRFGTVKALRAATVEEIAAVVGDRLARRISASIDGAG